MTTSLSQRDDKGHLLKVVKEEGGHAKSYEHHYGEELEKCQREDELLEYLLKVPEYEREIVVIGRRVSQVVVEIEIYTSLQTHGVLASIKRSEEEGLTIVKKLEHEFLLESKIKVLGQKKIMKREMYLKALRMYGRLKRAANSLKMIM